VDYWAKIGRLAELHPGLTFDYLQKLMRENRLQQLDANRPLQKPNQMIFRSAHR
jgi:hypothetical protein